MKEWLDVLSQYRIPYLLPNNDYKDKGTAYQGNLSRQIICYDKQKQMREVYGYETPFLKNILRLEMRYRSTNAVKRSMRRALGRDVAPILATGSSDQWLGTVQDQLTDMIESVVSAPSLADAEAIMKMNNWTNAVIRHHVTWLGQLMQLGVRAMFLKNPQKFYRMKRKLGSIGLAVMISFGLQVPQRLSKEKENILVA
ncbi:hypothetical protein [Alicyclobacillus sp. SO9]|uniref:hypothetical protein n=1 Tax=Alicyclobacillus sp. SO9 TaxID=2665646 RepID=UPI0018E85CDC|nr:hypothetical protein [Alicyclobacillus sp. SO9]QQE77300.1 hypothetical protein GI364_15180 [Alicyclobacillus sp. SO9]